MNLSKLVVIGLFGVSTQWAIGASFDCASPNVTRPADKLICANAEISKLDETLANLFNQTKSQLAEPAQATFVNGQRSWLGYWPRYCSTDGKARVFDKNSVACVKQAYVSRIEQLRLKFLDRKFPYFVASKYSAVNPSKDVPDYVTVVTHEQSYPQFEMQGLTPDESQIANQMNGWIGTMVRKANINFNNADAADSLNVSVNSTSPDIVTAVLAMEMNGFGAHPVSSFSQSHFVKSKLKTLTAADIFKGRDWMAPISRLIFQSLKKQTSDGLLINNANELMPMIGDPRSWSLTKQGLAFQFNVYEVAPYAMGPQEAVIPWQTLMPYLTDYAKSEITKLYK